MRHDDATILEFTPPERGDCPRRASPDREILLAYGPAVSRSTILKQRTGGGSPYHGEVAPRSQEFSLTWFLHSRMISSASRFGSFSGSILKTLAFMMMVSISFNSSSIFALSFFIHTLLRVI